MGDRSTIEWTDATWNPVTGCSKVSPGCAHCYAEELTMRFAGTWHVPKLPWTPENSGLNVILHPERLDQPLRWHRPRRVFVNSMSDLFHERVPAKFIAKVFGVMSAASWHTFQVLTKRPERMAELLHDERWLEHFRFEAPYLEPEWPIPNVWLGTSIENRRFVHRADALRETPAAVRFISAEPLLGPLLPKVEGDEDECVAWWPNDGRPCVPYDGLDLHDIDWLIVGGESGPKARPIDPEWVRDLRDAAEHLDVAFFFKQWGGRTPKAAGRELDGWTWDEFPQVDRATSGVGWPE